MNVFWFIICFICVIIRGLLLGTTIAKIWRIDRKIKEIQELQHLNALKDVLEQEVHKPCKCSDDCKCSDGIDEKVQKEIMDSITASDTEATAKKKAEKILKKYGLKADIEVKKFSTKKKPTAKKTTTKKKSTKKGTK